MGMTVTEKILAAHSGRDEVTPGQSVWVDVDVLMTHDVCGPGTIGIFAEQFGADAKVFDPDKIVIVPDHYIFTADRKAHRNVDILRDFVRAQGIRNYYDPDFLPAGHQGAVKPYTDPETTPFQGVCHAALAERGHARPGEVLLGTDSHTCTAGAFGEFATGIGNTDAAFVMGTGKLWLRVPETMKFVFGGTMPPYLMGKDLILAAIGEIGVGGATYCAMEFSGEALAGLNVDERMTVTNMAIEAGAKNAVVPADEVTLAHVRSRTGRDFRPVGSDGDARYASVLRWDVEEIPPAVAMPHSPGNLAAACDVEDVKIDRVYIGSCTGGKATDMLAAAKVLRGRRVAAETYVVPATTDVDAAMSRMTVGQQTVRQVLAAAGCRIGPASCAACLGGPRDTFGRVNDPLSVVSTTNRNFPGRMGHKEARVHLASPLTAAASAVAGHIADPRDYIDFDKAVGAVG